MAQKTRYFKGTKWGIWKLENDIVYFNFYNCPHHDDKIFKIDYDMSPSELENTRKELTESQVRKQYPEAFKKTRNEKKESKQESWSQ